jgi:hypothetical protein
MNKEQVDILTRFNDNVDFLKSVIKTDAKAAKPTRKQMVDAMSKQFKQVSIINHIKK